MITNSIFKQFFGDLTAFQTYWASKTAEEQAILKKSIVFIHPESVSDEWAGSGYIFANGHLYSCVETNLTASQLIALIETGNTSGVSVEEKDGKLIFTPVIKNDLIVTADKVGFIEAGHSWAAGTSIEQILNDIFSQEVWYKADFTKSHNMSVSIPQPSIDVKIGGTTITSTTGTYEIGAPVECTYAVQGSTVAKTSGDSYAITHTFKGSNYNGCVLNNGAELTKDIKSYTIEGGTAVTGTTGSDSATGVTSSGAFKSLSTTVTGTTSKITSGTNSLEVQVKSQTYKLELSTGATGTTGLIIYTLSNKGNKPVDESGNLVSTKDGVDVSFELGTSVAATASATNSKKISFTGAYKYYYVWGAAELPTIPEDFCGDLEGWDENWGSKTLYKDTPTTLNGYIYILKPASNGAPTINNEFTQAGEFTKETTSYTNKYGTVYSLYSFSSAGSKYKDIVL